MAAMDIEKSTGSTHGPDDDADGEINLAVYLLAIWRGRYVIVVVTALCAVTALVVTRLMPRTYEAASRLVVVTPKSSVGTTIAQALSEMGRDRAPNVATFRELAGSRSLAARVVTEFQLSSAPDFLTPPGFLANCVTIETPKDTEVIEVRVRLRQPDLAARVANRMADGAVELAARMNEQEAATMTDVIQTQLGESRSRFERANANLQALRATPQGGTPRAAANRTATNGGPRSRETELNELQTEYDLAKAAYVDVATRYAQTRLQVTSHSPSLQVVDRAVPPSSPIAPRPLQTTAVVAAIAFGLSVFGALVADYILRVARARSDRARGPART